MTDTLIISAGILAGLSALFALLTFRRMTSFPSDAGATEAQISQLLAAQTDRVRQFSDDQARGLRQELSSTLIAFQETTTKGLLDIGSALGVQVKDFGERLDAGVKAVQDRTIGIGAKLDQDIARMGVEANEHREALRLVIEGRLDDSTGKHAVAAKELREVMIAGFESFRGSVSDTLNQSGALQKERLDGVTVALAALSDRHEKTQEALRQLVEGRLEAIRVENTAKLDEMRKTVDEKLQTTLDARLGESFNRVVEHLERVHKGIGEMQSLAAGVGDLKKVLTNVRTRGSFGEVQLGALLEQFLSPEQFIRNAQIKENSSERVEFAVRLPGRDGDKEVLLSIDAKFPHEDYERLVAATEVGDADAIADAVKALEARVRASAKLISEKYIHPPTTTNFAIMFLPTESLYAEVLRKPGLFEALQREYSVTLTGPTTLTALLNALQMGFRTLAIERRSSEVWQILGAVKTEFGKYNEAVDRLSKQLDTASKSVEALGTRTRAMTRKLRDVEKLPDQEAQTILGPLASDDSDGDDEVSLKPGA